LTVAAALVCFFRQAVSWELTFSRFLTGFFERLQHADALLQCALQQHRVYADREQAEAFSPVLAAPFFVSGHAGEDFAVLGCGGDHFLDRGDVFGMVELCRDAEEIGQVEVPEPEHVHARYRGNFLHVLDALNGFDQAHHQGTLVGDLDLVGNASADVIVGRKSERRAAPARWRIAGAGDDVLSLLGGSDHGAMIPMMPRSSAREM